MSAANDLYDRIAATGKPLTNTERQKITEAQQIASEQVANEHSHTTPQTLLDKILSKIPTLTKIIADIGDTIITLSRALLIALLPVVLILAMVVEQQRVLHGLQLFEPSEELASLGAWLLVIANLLIELVINYINTREGYKPTLSKKRSLRLVWSDFMYFMGFGKHWTATVHSPARRYELVLQAITWAILFLAVGGSMRTVIESVDGNYFVGIVTILTDSTLLEMITWLSGLAFAVVVVKVAQALTAYISLRAAEFAVEISKRTGGKDALAQTQQAARDAVERQHLIAALNRRGVSTDNDDNFIDDLDAVDSDNPAFANGRANPRTYKTCEVCGQPFRTRQGHVKRCKNCR